MNEPESSGLPGRKVKRWTVRPTRAECARMERLKVKWDTGSKSEVIRRCMELAEQIADAEMVVVLNSDGSQSHLQIK